MPLRIPWQEMLINWIVISALKNVISANHDLSGRFYGCNHANTTIAVLRLSDCRVYWHRHTNILVSLEVPGRSGSLVMFSCRLLVFSLSCKPSGCCLTA